MNTNNHHEPIEKLTGPDDIIDTNVDDGDSTKDAVQENLEGEEPSKEETETDPKDADVSRSE
ncbi:hypothetical protein D0C36_22765 [Mucilaginibacter conchicola]|uniref:Uncharacterized protein n=1 Tax=Mucilaginibacter conchicola TaxID=2303333 RepID=A0A372NN72_9SPHI|nr:hypothetical protein [Mucilaginibacter conchicola]RFZ90067.1 hypothetical protein D0C36_22765 [Mucilaginibacter conchicola]